MENPFEELKNKLEEIQRALIELKQSLSITSSDGSDQDIWFDIEGLCEYLPDKPAKATAYGWVHTNSIPYHKGTKKLRFLKSEIDAWLKRGKRLTIDEIRSEAHHYETKKKLVK